MDFNRLRFIAERSEIGEHKEAMLSVIIPETPGRFVSNIYSLVIINLNSFYKLYSIIYPRNVTAASYRYSLPTEAFMYVAFKLEFHPLSYLLYLQIIDIFHLKL